MSTNRGKRIATVTVSTIALVFGVGAVASASIPDSNGVIYGCVKADGTLIVKDDNGTGNITCGAQATKITWNRQGPTGPQGPAGPQGVPGPAGPAGAGTVVATADNAGPINVPSAQVLPPNATENPTIIVMTVPFTLATESLIHLLAYGDVTVDDNATCDGYHADYHGYLYAKADGHIVSTTTPASGRGMAASTPVWMAAGSHTVEIVFGPQGCWTSATGTDTITNLHVRAVSY